MPTPYDAFVGILCLPFVLAGGYFQYKSFKNIFSIDHKSNLLRFFSPVIIGAIIIIGLFLQYLISLADQNSNSDIYYYVNVSWSIIGIFIIFTFKNMLAPTFLFALIIWGLYNYMQYGKLEYLAFFEFVVKNLLFWAPEWIKFPYFYITTSYLLVAEIFYSYKQAAN